MRTGNEVSTAHLDICTASSSIMSTFTITPIDKNWTFKQADSTNAKFLPVAQFPTNVHLDLISNGIISDPFIGKNENDVQWVGEVPWVYKTTFPSPTLSIDCQEDVKAVLVFDGLDTFATVLLNGKEILKTASMFIPKRVDITKDLNTEGDNELEITFESAYLKGCAIVEEHPNHKWGCWNGDVSRLAVRKAQYHWV
jgi:beta-mannosidase